MIYVFSKYFNYSEVASYLKPQKLIDYVVAGCALTAIGIYAPLATLAVTGAFALTTCLSSGSKTPIEIKPSETLPLEIEPLDVFPFSTQTLPPLHRDGKIWFQKTGMTLEEVDLIDGYIQNHLQEWERDVAADTVLRITKEESKLPRTIHIFRAYDRLCIQVLCKTKQIKQIGKGGFKVAKVSVEWCTKTLWAQYVVPPEDWEDVQNGLAIQDQFAGQIGIFPSAIGKSIYRSKKGSERFSFFGPLREGTYRDIDPNLPEFFEQKNLIAHQLLAALYVLEKQNVRHGDVKDENVLFYRDVTGKVYVELSDFDLAKQENDLAILRETMRAISNRYSDDIRHIVDCLKQIKVDSGFIDKIGQEIHSARQALMEFEQKYGK